MALTLKSVTGSRVSLVAALLLLPVIYFYPVITSHVTLLPGDGWTQIFGIRMLTGKLIAQGLLPLWNPYIFGGMPLLASIQPGALYPPSWLFALLSPRAAMNVMVITTYHLALIGAYLYARRIGIDRTGALISGLAFAFSGYLISHLGHTNRIAAAAWLPWILLAVENLSLTARWRWVTLGSFFIALQMLAGEPQMTCYTGLLTAAYWAFTLLFRKPPAGRWRFIITTTTMALGGALLSAMQLLPTRELLEQGPRGKHTYEYFALYALPPHQLTEFILPYFYGGAVAGPYHIPFWGREAITETCGYVGLLALLLALTALVGRRRQPLVWFWAAVVVVSLLLACGAYLPFEVNRALYRIPVYNLFRASGRHLLECDFALAVLAGLGAQFISERKPAETARAALAGTLLLAALVALTLVLYLFFGERLVSSLPRPPQAGSIATPEAFVPLVLFIISTAVCWLHLRQRRAWSGAAMVAVLFIDLGSFGHFFDWRVYDFDVAARLADPPAVSFIKQREPDFNGFRVASSTVRPWPFGAAYDQINAPNVSIARGLQSINGYDPVRLLRLSAITGEMSIEGEPQNLNVYGAEHQGFNLLNVKYLLHERAQADAARPSVNYEGIVFDEKPLHLKLPPGSQLEFTPPGITAAELAIVSTLANSIHLPDGAPVARITLHTRDGQIIERELQAGRDTAEWSWDEPHTSQAARHHRAKVVSSWPVNEAFQGHHYLARLAFERSDITRITLQSAQSAGGPVADVLLMRLSLFDPVTGRSAPLDPVALPATRWRKLQSFGAVDLYENLKAQPRAWFVREVAARPAAEVLQAVTSGRMKDGQPFDPAQTALLETEDFGARAITLPATGPVSEAQVSVTKYEPQRIELVTHNAQPGFLVLSEIYYRGWEAWIDGQRVPVERANYVLRGLAVPAGEHRVEFIFRAHSFRNGAMYSLLGALLLTGGALLQRRYSRRRAEKQI